MNARAPQISGEQARRLFSRLSACAALGALLTGCVGDPVRSAKIEATSPIGADATRIVQANPTWPRFRDIPPAPKDVRPAQSYGAAASEIVDAGNKLEQATAPGTWSLTPSLVADSGANRLSQEEEIEGRDSDAFARSARERATPPPPPR
jgi:hypothetical protein